MTNQRVYIIFIALLGVLVLAGCGGSSTHATTTIVVQSEAANEPNLQVSKAYDASAKELARTAETTAETYATDHNGTYEGMTTEAMQKYEPTLTSCGLAGENACFIKGEATESHLGFKVEAEAYKTKDRFSIERNKEGTITRKCTSETSGCMGGTSSSW